ncbi:cation-translocating P-type ATPase [Propylenella binzhouense]|uniref:Cation-transporting P-type ATPase n=1 Tax=Propylenella binzhouense TaxID=2555902 RepID=A0A964WST5_9HYPH|nr:cation-transporting P-type ATPase [Propylenella binzhouense]MYZ47135.1 cation-transporting P-type ATPase [Propylenella binzhouense]
MNEAVVVRHHIPGRTRLVVSAWPEPGGLRRLESALSAHHGRVASANPLTRTLLLRHGRDLNPAALAACVAAALSEQSPEPSIADRECGPAGRHPISGAADPGPISPDAIARQSIPDALAGLGSTPRGISCEEARDRLAAFGPNAMPEPEGRSRGEMLLSQLTTVPVALLAGSAVLSLATGGIVDAAVTIGVVFVNAAIGFSSEDATERLIRRLSRPIEHEATVCRAGKTIRIRGRDVVPGDVVLLSPSSIVPADARVLEANDVALDEAVLTGESLPAEKTADAMETAPSGVADRRNIVHGGTVVTGGNARAVIFRTGTNTEMAWTRGLIGNATPPRPASEEALASLGVRLAAGCIAISGLVMGIGLIRGEPFVAMAKSAIALAVSAIPEGLPAVATTALALGARAMEREGAFVRALPAVEAIGTVDTICLDKTGTLTENRMAVAAIHLGGETRELAPGERWPTAEQPDLEALARAVTLCNEARLGRLSGTATELALLRFAADLGLDPDGLQDLAPIRAARSRDARRRWMATEHALNGAPYIALKGAPDELLALSGTELIQGGARPLTPERRESILEANGALARKGLRVLGVAQAASALDHDQPQDLVWLGLIALADPVRMEAREAIGILHRAGVRTVMITGDQPATALSVAQALDLSRTSIVNIADGAQIGRLDDAALGELALRTSVFARVSPSDKLRIVQALQGAGRRVAMIGDGVNDGPALRAAAVGVAMGRNGTDVAREVADIVIADDDLRELARAIARGRATDDNVRNSVRYLLATNFSEVLVMLTEALHGRGELEAPMELFWLNLVTDILPAIGLALAEPRGDVLARPPRAVDAGYFTRGEAAGIGLDGAGIAAAALAAHFTTMARAGLGPRARTATFTTLALAQIAHAWTLRDRSPGADAALLASERRLEAFLAAAAALLAVPFLLPPLRRLLGIAPPAPGDLLAAGALAGTSFALAEGRRIIARGGRSAKAPG